MILILTFAGSGFAQTAQTANMERVTLLLSKGSPEVGRRTFQDLLCTSCHRVQGETRFPKPFSGYEGPVLGKKKAAQTTSDLAMSILVPSHKVSEDLKKKLKGSGSPMTDYSDVVTFRQLADLVAYLGSIK